MHGTGFLMNLRFPFDHVLGYIPRYSPVEIMVLLLFDLIEFWRGRRGCNRTGGENTAGKESKGGLLSRR